MIGLAAGFRAESANLFGCFAFFGAGLASAAPNCGTKLLQETVMTAAHFSKIGLEAMLTLDNCVLMLIDHQLFQAAAPSDSRF